MESTTAGRSAPLAPEAPAPSEGRPSAAELCALAREASRTLAQVPTSVKDAALEAMAASLTERAEEILAANQLDMESGREASLSDALLDRLRLDEERLRGIAQAVRQIVALPDPVGEVIDGRRLPNGLDVRKVRVPLGVVAVVYEARPNVTIDATALCTKSGNAIVLRGSSVASNSNAVLARVAADAASAEGLPEGSVVLVQGGGREELAEIARQSESVDLIIPRGGEELKAALQAVARVPVIYAASGNCHVYVDAGADLDEAEAIVLNAKVQRPGVCNAAEKVLVHRAVADRFVPRIVAALDGAGVEVRADERTASAAGEHAQKLVAAADEDWATEYLGMTIAIAVVDSVEQAIAHIGRHGSAHSEAIVTRDAGAARAFQLGVDAACVYVNASTRFTDGGEFGMGAEIGNSTQKLHTRGPIGLRELCTYKYLVEGDGHVRP
jgi:glutamate-5-semialdehyde dehydrogenase